MTLEFRKEVINNELDYQKAYQTTNFIGYLNPKGKVIDYSMPTGIGGHDGNLTTDLFMEWFDIGEHYDDFGWPIIRTDESERKSCEFHRGELIKRINDFQYYEDMDPYFILDQNLRQFFYNCYSNNSFITGFGRNYHIMDKHQFYKNIFSKKNTAMTLGGCLTINIIGIK